MKKIDINTVNPDELVDITSIDIDTSLSKNDRIKEFLTIIKNPYCFKCEGVIVMVDFAGEDRTIEDGLLQYFKSKMQ